MTSDSEQNMTLQTPVVDLYRAANSLLTEPPRVPRDQEYRTALRNLLQLIVLSILGRDLDEDELDLVWDEGIVGLEELWEGWNATATEPPPSAD